MHKAEEIVKTAHPKPASGIREVAKLAKVSVATVSRVFNHPETVRKQTRDHVHLAADQLGYIPDSAARKLGSQVNRRIGLLVPTIEDSIFTKFIGSLHQEISKSGYTLLLGAYGFDPEREQAELRGLIESGVDAVILCGEQRPSELYELLERRKLPFLNFNIFAPESPHYSIGPNFRMAAQNVANYLIELGHRDIGSLDFFSEINDRAAQRRLGIQDALRDHGLEYNPRNFMECDFGYEDGRIGFRSLLQSSPNITATICGNDVLAIGALFEARDSGISVPTDMSITGFDNLDLASQVSPTLTTVHLRNREMGTRAAESILRLIEGTPSPKAIQLEANLILRESTCAPSQNRRSGD